MWIFRTLRLFTKSLTRIATALEGIHTLYRADLASRGVILTDATIEDPVEVAYGFTPLEEEQ